MRSLAWIGIIVLVFGILSFIVPFPTSHSRGVKVGDASVDITTHRPKSYRRPLAVSFVPLEWCCSSPARVKSPLD